MAARHRGRNTRRYIRNIEHGADNVARTSVSVSFLPNITITNACTSSSSTSPTSSSFSTHATGAMKWQSQRRPTEVRPFLVLPLLDAERSSSADGVPTSKRNPSPATRTGTWPPKLKIKPRNEDHPSRIERPLTATLERPELLNINLMDKLDMSKVRKEFLCITNLCKDSVTVAIIAKGRRGVRGKQVTPPAICVTPNCDNSKRSRKPETSEDSLESDENMSVRRSRRKMSKVNKLASKPVKVGQNSSDANNNSDAKLEPTKSAGPQNRSIRRSKTKTLPSAVSPKPPDDSLRPGGARLPPASATAAPLPLPEPCTTCGRPDQPERFHSHPATPLVRPANRDSPRKTLQPKSSVQKPVAIKYKSQPRDRSPQKMATAKVAQNDSVKGQSDLRSKSPVRGPRTVMCYICGREFGTASLPLHEPKCLQKWERENSQLPRHLQRKAPIKPDKPMTPEEWNKFAWEASQATLTPCNNCGRTFLPDRLIVHQRSCKSTPGGNNSHFHRSTHNIAAANRSPPPDLVLSSLSSTPSHGSGDRSMPTSPPGPGGPPTVECYICGRMFGTKSIAIHEPQCLRKWHAQNDQLPPSQRRPPPTKDGPSSRHSGAPDKAPSPSGGAAAGPSSSTQRPSSGPKKPMLPCYICGREYGTSSIYIHEPQCLKKWRQENDRLPPSQRRKEPERPDIKFTPSGQIDYEATSEAIWQSHLSQLVPCQMCGRTFNPNRVVVHQRSCKGQ